MNMIFSVEFYSYNFPTLQQDKAWSFFFSCQVPELWLQAKHRVVGWENGLCLGLKAEHPMVLFFEIFSLGVVLLMEEVPHQLIICNFSHSLQGFIHPRWFSRPISEPSTVVFEGVFVLWWEGGDE